MNVSMCYQQAHYVHVSTKSCSSDSDAMRGNVESSKTYSS